jgi:hypothetical protein
LFDEDELALAAVFAVQVDHGVAGGAGTRERIERQRGLIVPDDRVQRIVR